MPTYKIVNAGATPQALEQLLNEQAAQGYSLASIAVLPNGAYVAALKRDGYAEVAEAKAADTGAVTLAEVATMKGTPVSNLADVALGAARSRPLNISRKPVTKK